MATITSRDVVLSELYDMTPKQRKKLLGELPQLFCNGCGGDTQNGICTCGGTTIVTFHRDGSVTAKKPKRAR